MKKEILTFVMSLLLIGAAFSQGINVSGSVTDNEGIPIPGASVLVRGTMHGTVSNADGVYTLSNVPPDAILQVSFVGMRTIEVPVERRTSINFVLEEDLIGLDEIIVVAYGQQSRRTVTGSVSTASSDDITRSNATLPSQALAGKIQGITSRSQDSRPGRGANLEIRNMGSPLFVIDGIAYDGRTGTDAFGMARGGGEDIFNNLNPEDIESVTILKDASAAIYGLRAANGVVLVTTKVGSRDQPTRINVNSYYGVQNFTRFFEMANAPTYLEGLMQNALNTGGNPNSVVTPDEFAKWQDGTYKSYNYNKFMFRKNVPQYHVNASASGGTDRSQYYFSVSHNSQDAVLRDFEYGRTNIQVNLESNIASGLRIGTRTTMSLEETLNVGVPGLDDYWNPFYTVTNMWPTESPYANDNPNYVHQTNNVNVNPATYTRDITGWVDNFWHRFNTNIYAQYDFDFGLTARATLSYNFMNFHMDGFEYTYDAYKYGTPPPGATVVEQDGTNAYYKMPGWGNQNPWREQHKMNVVSRFAQFQLNYSKQLGDHFVSAIAAYERNDYDNAELVVHTVPSNNYVERMYFSEQDYLSDQWRVQARAGYIGRVNYNYQQKYLAEFIARYDGSYLYHPDNRWGFFPAVSLAWQIGQEGFFQNIFGNTFDEFKLRASYGQTGSETGVSQWGYLEGFNFGSGSFIYSADNSTTGLAPRGMPVTNLSWTKNHSTNIGVDFAIMNGRFSGTFDVFERRRTGIPASRYDVLLPSEVGYGLPNENLNSDAHRGVEGILRYRDQAGDISYSIAVHATLARRKMLETYKPRFANSWDEYRSSSEDRWTSINWGYTAVGQFQSMEEINNYPVDNDGRGNTTMLPGDIIYQDTNGDGVINTMDYTPIGYATGSNPYMSSGINGSVQWKNFSLTFDFSGGFMQTYRRQWEGLIPYQSNGNVIAYMVNDAWRRSDPYDANSEWIPGNYPPIRTSNSHVNYSRHSTFWTTNVNYLRLKNLELGYEIPQEIIGRAGLSRARVYLNATNLFSIDNLKDAQIDPEITSTSALQYPQQKVLNVGMNLTF